VLGLEFIFFCRDKGILTITLSSFYFSALTIIYYNSQFTSANHLAQLAVVRQMGIHQTQLKEREAGNT